MTIIWPWYNHYGIVFTIEIPLGWSFQGPSKADELASNMLVFLLAPEEELPQIKRDKSISEMVAEKLKSKKRSESVDKMESVSVQPKGESKSRRYE